MPRLQQHTQGLFGEPLAANGFALVDDAETWAYVLPTSDGSQLYVRIKVSLDPRDRPWSVGVRIGEGSLAYPEVDWNGLPLWVLVKARTGSIPNYSFGSEREIPAARAAAAADLFLHAGDFLRGDLTTFRSERAKLNQSREPYVVHRGQSHAAPQATSESLDLKRRYSVE
jgi:hypothetical protein